ncbi:hypothetical protein CLIM01_10370 [Colletotrichum limetticola]|uniref:Uncharacterized protein n=1 Tax=Colletotrichum limetticola TaxID=1209924 RepID=A0ABQ9PLI5_9PEZI|nr:hypothetical protein CLIM01_10370 [Colletotrichum limetticola]
MLKHIFDPANKLVTRSGMIHNGAEIRHTWETTFVPRDMTYFSTKKNKRVPLSLRTDVMFVLKAPEKNLNVQDMMPGLATRPFAIIELKRLGTFDAMVAELKHIALQGTDGEDGEESNIVEFSEATQEYLRQLALYCSGARTQFGTLCDYKSMILIQFTGMNVRSGMTPAENYFHGHGGTFTFSIVKNHREKPLALAGWLRIAAESTAPHI